MSTEIDPKVGEDMAAAHCGLASATLSTMRCRGNGPPYFKLGRRVVYSLRDLDAWLAARRVRSTADTPASLAVETIPDSKPRRRRRVKGGADATSHR